MSDFGYSIRDRTSSKGFVPGMQGMFDAMRQAAAEAGLSRLEMVAGKGQGHLSHAHGTEADIVGYNADGSKWSKAQRVAVARGASTAGGNRFGFYSGPTLHVGLGYQGSPHNVVWNNKLRGVPGVTSFAPEEQAFVNALRAGKLASYTQGPINASGVSGNPQVAAMQKSLNALGAGLKEDGIMGPLTRAAQAKYSPYTSPSAQAYTSKASLQSPALQAAARQAQVTAPRTPQPRPQSPYTNSTGGAYTSDRQDLGTGVPAPPSMNVRNMRVPTQTIDASGYSPLSASQVFTPPAQQAPVARIPQARPPGLQWSSLQSPYTNSTGGTNALQPARLPQPRPPGLQWSSLQQPAQPVARIPQARPPGLQWSQLQQPTLMQQLHDQMQRDAAAASQSSRSGMGYQGGGYTGGSYGGAGGRSIASGVGGAFRNR
jgi:hypothetical protein